jgi:hypothetical protein
MYFGINWEINETHTHSLLLSLVVVVAHNEISGCKGKRNFNQFRSPLDLPLSLLLHFKPQTEDFTSLLDKHRHRTRQFYILSTRSLSLAFHPIARLKNVTKFFLAHGETSHSSGSLKEMIFFSLSLVKSLPIPLLPLLA